jgi:SNF2 family DNA or RNA helicase
MSLIQWIGSLVGSKDGQRYRQVFDFEGANFLCSEDQKCVIGQGKADELITQQHVLLRMLVEQGDGHELLNGFLIPSDVIVNLDEYSRQILELPAIWQGSIQTDIHSQTGRSLFRIEATANYANGRHTAAYRIDGPTIRFSEESRFLLTPAQLSVFDALEKHRESEHTEFDNLTVIAALQKAQQEGVNIALGHFERLRIHTPDAVLVEAELDANGNLILTPQLGQQASHEDMQRVLGQLRDGRAASLRVKDEIILIDEKKMAGIREVLKNRIVSKEKLDDFYKNPTAFIDASLVNLDLGFSARVRGATRFRHAYFGETDESGIDWFGRKFNPVNVYPANKLNETIKDEFQLQLFEQAAEQALTTGAQEVEFEGRVYNISDPEQVKNVAEAIRYSWLEPLAADMEVQESSAEYVVKEDVMPVVVDIALNDDDLETPSDIVERKLADVLAPEDSLCWDNYLRAPFPHQIFGVRWLLGLATEENGLGGGLLADDMGLGKTFMSLAALEHLYRQWRLADRTLKPCLIVAPLSLLQNWKDEVGKTFVTSPFRDIVILQSEGELNDFRLAGVETRNQSLEEGEEAVIRYSLKIGADFANDRLDMPGRLVITTYQTLRDYQFSLCAIDWGVVAFDEAQNIKNPNALQTRAAKGLKADFRLLATGTPVENSLADFWCIMDTACPGFLDSYQAFRDAYVTPIVRAAGDELEETRARVGRQLRDNVGALMLRRLKEDNLDGLPEKRLYVGLDGSEWAYLPVLSSVMTGPQLESYESVLSGVVEAGESAALAGLHQLRDVSLHHRLLMGGKMDLPEKKRALDELMMESGKFNSLLALLRDIRGRQEKVIIFCINKRLQAFLSIALARCFELPALAIINGDTKAVTKREGAQTRKTLIEAFERKDGFNIILMSPVAAGVGLTVVGANNVIHLERHWNPAKEAQATDRIYRIGQQRDVNVYIPIVRHPELMSFDENLHRLLSKKSLLRDAVVTPEQVLPSPEGFASSGLAASHRIGPEDLNRLGWEEFEALTAELLAALWHASSCMLTARGPDQGADVVLENESGVILVQCKQVSGSGAYARSDAIKEIYSAKPAYEQALGKTIHQLVFVTNAPGVSSATRATARVHEVEVISGRQLSEWLAQQPIVFSTITRRLAAIRLKV